MSCMFSGLPVEKSSRPRTVSPRLTSSCAIDEPMNPAMPVTRYFAILCGPHLGLQIVSSTLMLLVDFCTQANFAAAGGRQTMLFDLIQQCFVADVQLRSSHLAVPVGVVQSALDLAGFGVVL